MSPDQVLRWFLIFAGFVPTTLFIIGYHRHARWWETPYGQHLMAFSFVIWLVYLNGMLTRIVDAWPSAVSSTVLYTLGAVVTWQRYIVYRMARRRAKREPENHPKRRRTDLP